VPVAGSTVSCYHSQSLETCLLSWYKWMRTPSPYSLYTYTRRDWHTWVRILEDSSGGGADARFRPTGIVDTAMLSKLSFSGPPSRLRNHKQRVPPAGHRSKYSSGTNPHSSLRASVGPIHTCIHKHCAILVASTLKTEVACIREKSGNAHIHMAQNPTPTTTVEVSEVDLMTDVRQEGRRHTDLQATQQNDTTAHKKCRWRSFVQWKSRLRIYGWKWIKGI
jgi:hypothetical protein